MLGTIIKREIMEYIKSAKLLISLIVTISLMAISASINIRDLVQRRQDCSASSQLQNQSVQNGTEVSEIFRRPQILGFLVVGKERALGFSQRMFSDSIFPTGYSGKFLHAHGTFVSGFQNMDFSFVVKVALSLMVIFLAYNAVAGEKAMGTLKVALSNSVSRSAFLLGKFFGGMIVILGSFFLSSLVVLLMALFNPSLSLSGSDIIRIAAFLAISSLYLVFFFALSLFISVSSDRPSTALMILILAWIFLVVIYPAVSIRLAQSLYPIPGQEEITKRIADATGPYRAEINRYLPELNKSFENKELNRYWSNKMWENKLKIFAIERNISEDQSRRMSAQMRTAEIAAALSPAMLYDMAAERLARTGIYEFERFREALLRYEAIYIEQLHENEDSEQWKAPEFVYESENLSSSIAATLPNGILILLGSLIYFFLGLARFLRKDLQ